jgi:hypothetical protein
MNVECEIGNLAKGLAETLGGDAERVAVFPKVSGETWGFESHAAHQHTLLPVGIAGLIAPVVSRRSVTSEDSPAGCRFPEFHSISLAKHLHKHGHVARDRHSQVRRATRSQLRPRPSQRCEHGPRPPIASGQCRRLQNLSRRRSRRVPPPRVGIAAHGDG